MNNDYGSLSASSVYETQLSEDGRLINQAYWPSDDDSGLTSDVATASVDGAAAWLSSVLASTAGVSTTWSLAAAGGDGAGNLTSAASSPALAAVSLTAATGTPSGGAAGVAAVAASAAASAGPTTGAHCGLTSAISAHADAASLAADSSTRDDD